MNSNGQIASMSDCSLTLYIGSNYVSVTFTPLRDGTIYKYGTDEKVADCTANTSIALLSNVYAPNISGLAYVFK